MPRATKTQNKRENKEKAADARLSDNGIG